MSKAKKLKLFFAFAIFILAVHVSAQTNRIWNFKGGTNLEGIYVSSGTTAFVVKNHGTNLSLSLMI
jgi:hypothetical protein